MIEASIRQIDHGYIYKISGSVKDNGEYPCMNTDEMKMFEKIIQVILGYRVEIKRR